MNKIITIPSIFVLIAITHGTNYTQSSRSVVNKNMDILKLINFEDLLYLNELYDV